MYQGWLQNVHQFIRYHPGPFVVILALSIAIQFVVIQALSTAIQSLHKTLWL